MSRTSRRRRKSPAPPSPVDPEIRRIRKEDRADHDLVKAIIHHLHQRGELDGVGGQAEIAGFFTYAPVPTVARLKKAEEILNRELARRLAIRAGVNMAEEAFACGEEIERVLDASSSPVCDIPPDCIVDPDKSNVVCEDPGTTLTLDIGTAANPDGLADSITLSNSGQVAFTSGTLPAEAIAPVMTTEKTRVFMTIASASGLTEGKKVVVNIAYCIGCFQELASRENRYGRKMHRKCTATSSTQTNKGSLSAP